jgi:Right handed beta helix region
MKHYFRMLMAVMLISGLSHTAIADNVSFGYQGRVRVQGVPYTGNGLFKFAIVNTSATATLWSNDGTLAGEPAGSVSIPVSDGAFSVNIGDTNIPGMSALNGAIFTSTSPAKLRVWFNGGLGFQHLQPDHVLNDLTLNIIQTGLEDLTIYVNGTTGNDSNNGLTPATAKKTIQAAVDILPDRIRCNVIVDVAPGIYREYVRIYGITVDPIKSLRLLGDESWTETSAGNPSVRVTGTDQDASPTRVRPYCMRVDNSSNVTIEGFHFDWASDSGLHLRNGDYKVKRCKATNNAFGINAQPQAYVDFVSCVGSSNVYHGLCVSRSSEATMTSCVGSNNGQNGIICHQSSYIQFFTKLIIDSNGQAGINFGGFASGSFWSPGVFQVNNNGNYGITVGWKASVAPGGLVTFSNNQFGTILTFNEGSIF